MFQSDDPILPKEVKFLQKCQGVKGVVPLLDWYRINQGYCIVMPFLDNVCDLFDYVYENEVTEHISKIVMNQLVFILLDCRRLNISHSDLKMENILINVLTKEIHLIDFGCAKDFSYDICTSYSGTAENVPPEYILEKEYFMHSDEVWSLGLLMYDMLFKSYPFKNPSEISLKHLSFPSNRNISSDCMELIEWCLTKTPLLRPCLNCILNHSWLTI